MITQYSYGDNVHANADNNVIEMWKTWTSDEIRAALNPNRTELVNICMNLTKDYNKSCVIRSNNAFLGKEVYIVGKRRYDHRGCVGTNHIEHVYHADTIDEVVDKLHDQGYTIYAVDNVDSYNPKCIFDVEFPEKSAFIYGEEQNGLDSHTIELCDDMVYINQRGSVRSLNVAAAASVIMYEYSRQYQLAR